MIKNQHRPYIVFGISRQKPMVLNIVIQNTGDRIAKNVKIITLPKLKSNTVDEKFIADKLNYNSIMPFYKYETAFDFSTTAGDAPERYEIKIQYSDDCQLYEDNYIIDFSYLKNSLHSDQPDKTVKAIMSISEKMNESNKTIAENINNR